MTTFPGSPRILRGGLVLIDRLVRPVLRVIALQYNPDTLSRTLQIQAVGEAGDRSEALRLKGPPVETIKLEAEIDATDQLEFPDQQSERGAVRALSADSRRSRRSIYPSARELQSQQLVWRRPARSRSRPWKRR